MSDLVVLDAGGFDVLDSAEGRRLRALLQRAAERGGEVRCAAVTLAEVCRGPARTRRVEAALARRHAGQRIRVIDTDERLAKLVGAILHATRSDSSRLADAHVVAICAAGSVALVITTDPDDIIELAAAVPGTRVTAQRPSLTRR